MNIKEDDYNEPLIADPQKDW